MQPKESQIGQQAKGDDQVWLREPTRLGHFWIGRMMPMITNFDDVFMNMMCKLITGRQARKNWLKKKKNLMKLLRAKALPHF